MISKINKSLALEAAVLGGEAIMEVYKTAFDVIIKADNSPLTLADQNANDIIISFLEKTKIPIISEENKQLNYDVRKHWKQCWIVDPLDGTKEFINRNGDFTVNIALIEDGKPIWGVIYMPVTETLYVGDVSSQEALKLKVVAPDTLVTDLENKGEVLAFAKAPPLDANIRVVGSKSHMNAETQAYIQSLEVSGATVEMLSRGSSLKFCLIAEGNADVYPRFAPTMEWDTAAGQAICEAVGYEVIDQKTGVSMVYNRENMLNGHFLVQRSKTL
jgi:3'(2'), 5'-bisphosphate nucleotidase